MLQGMVPGPSMFKEHSDILYGIMIGLVVINILMPVSYTHLDVYKRQAYTPEKARAVSSFDLEGVNLGDTVVIQGCGAEIVVECVGRPEVFPEGLKYLRKAGMYLEQAEDAVKAGMTRESMKVVIDPWME